MSIPVQVDTLPLPEIGVGVDAVVLSDGPHLVVAGATGVDEIDPATGTSIVPYSSSGARAVLLRDAGSAVHVIVCSNSGLTFDDPVTDDLPTQLSVDPCGALLRVSNGFVAVGGPAVKWTSGSTGYTSTALGLDVLGEPVGAVDGQRVAVAGIGDDRLQVYTPTGVTSLLVGAEIGGVSALPGVWRLGLLDGRLYDLPGTWRTTVEAAGALTSVDLDGDGLLDTVVAYPYAGLIGVFAGDGSAEVRVPGPWGARALAAADLDLDGCGEVVVLDPGAAQLMVVSDPTCGSSGGDLDGDGSFSPADCNDTDPDIHPGALELCDQQDQDCDGQTDEFGVVIDAPETADEGTAPSLEARLGGCSPPSATFQWDVAYEDTVGVQSDAECSVLGAIVRCSGPDDGTLHAAVTVVDADGAVLGEDATDVEVRNVAPRLVLPPEWSQYGGMYGTYIWLQLPSASVFEVSLGADDVPDDELTFAVSGPWYVGVSTDGRFRVEGQPPYQYGDPVLLTVSDEDGGSEEWPVQLWFWGEGYDTGGYCWWCPDTGTTDTGWNDVGDGDGSDISCGGCCCWLVGLALPPIVFPLRRRWLGRR